MIDCALLAANVTPWWFTLVVVAVLLVGTLLGGFLRDIYARLQRS
ncbi:hypothetical protein LCGC14_1801440, partial [marine sediment metagenome]